LDQIVTGDETWVSHIIPENKCQPLEQHHSHSPSKKFEETLSTREGLATVLWDRTGVLVEFMPKGQTISAVSYCATLKRLQCTIQNRQRGQLSTGVVLLHDSVRSHTAASTCALLADFAWDVFSYPPYSLDLAPSDFHLFIHLKQFFDSMREGSDEEVKKTVKDWFSGLVADIYDVGIQKLVT
jgi:histone-lysine N-methyltransferase SETMAR